MKSTEYQRREHHEFLAASDVALADENLQQILGRLGDTLGARNRTAFGEFSQSDLTRERARGIKDETLAHLDEHLANLADNFERLGGHVHFCGDGAEAVRTVLEILQRSG